VTGRAGRLAATWPHDVEQQYPALVGQPAIESRFTQVAQWLGERPTVIDTSPGGEVLAAMELDRRIRRLAGGLADRGVGRGDAVCFQTPSWWETIALFRACWRLGAIAAPIHHLAAEADVAHVVATVSPALIVASAGSPAAQEGGVVEVRGDGGFESLLDATPVHGVRADPTDLAVVLFTSGSTGGPKGVLHTHRALIHKASTLIDVHGIDERDCVLMPAPMAHISGLSNAVMLPGAGGLRVVLMERWAPDAAVDLVATHGVTFMMGPPTFFSTMMTAPNFSADAVATMRTISCGGAGVTPAFVASASAAFGATVKRTYGSTEAPVVTTWHAGDDPNLAGAFDGRAASDIQLRLAEDGELQLLGPELFVGYSDPAATAAALTDDGWFRTGDLATLTEQAGGEDWLSIVGRIKDIIIRGGENISAAGVEATLEAHPAVGQAVAVGYPDERLGERVCAYVVLAPGATFDLPTCQAWFGAQSATKFTWPERVEVLAELPVLASSGKADRAALRALAAASVLS